MLLNQFSFEPMQAEPNADVRERAYAHVMQLVSDIPDGEIDYDYLFYIAELVDASLDVLRCKQDRSAVYVIKNTDRICSDLIADPSDRLEPVFLSELVWSVIDMILKCASIELRLPELIASSDEACLEFKGDVKAYIGFDPDVFYVPTMDFVEISLSNEMDAGAIQRAWRSYVLEMFAVLDKYEHDSNRLPCTPSQTSAAKTNPALVLYKSEIDLCETVSTRIKAKLAAVEQKEDCFPDERDRLEKRLEDIENRLEVVSAYVKGLPA